MKKLKLLYFDIILVFSICIFCGTSNALATNPSPTNSLLQQFNALGGYQAYLAANLGLFTNSGICDETSAYSHWVLFGKAQGLLFDSGKPRTDRPDGSPDTNYAIAGGFCWAYLSHGYTYKTLVFITQDAPKPNGWAGPSLLLKKGDLFDLGQIYTAAAYRQANPDVATAMDKGLFTNFASITDHYVKYGFREGRLASTNWTKAQLNSWNDAAYLTANPDVKKAFVTAQSQGWTLYGKVGFAHFMNFGDWEGRNTGQVMTGRQLEIQLKRKFDETGYLARNPDVASAVQNGYYTTGHDHFLQQGQYDYANGNLNRRPNNYFNNNFYLGANTNIVSTVWDLGTNSVITNNMPLYPTAWDQWWMTGANGGLAGLPIEVEFDATNYLIQNPQLTNIIGVGLTYPTPYIHYVNVGQQMGLNPNAYFDEKSYLASNPGVTNAIGLGIYTSGYDHFQQAGKYQYAQGYNNYRPYKWFDNSFYLSNYPSIAKLIPGTYATAWDQWVMVGAAQGNLSLPVEVGFDSNYYTSTYTNVVPLIGPGKSYANALMEYVQLGQFQGLNPNAWFNESYYDSYYQLQSNITSGMFTSGYDHYQRFGKNLGYRTYRSLNGVLTVGSGVNDYSTVQDAINAAVNGEQITIPPGIYTNGGFGIFDKSLTIGGAGQNQTFIQPGVKIDPAVIAATGGGIGVIYGSTTFPTVNISGITFQLGDNRETSTNYFNGVAGALTIRHAKSAISSCNFINNKSHTGGAMIFENSPGSTVSNCVFLNNSAERNGGAIAAFSNGLTSITGCLFQSNIMGTNPYNYVHSGNTGVHNSAGFSAVGVPYSAGATAKDGEFYDRNDTGAFIESSNPVVGPVYVGYYEGPLGGAIALDNSSPLIQGNSFSNNQANFAGGAIYMLEGAAPTINSNTFSGNQSSRGGAIYSEAGAVTALITSNTIINNKAPADANYPGSGQGGGIALYYNSQPNISSNNIFQNNTAGYGGGAIGIYESSSAQINGNSFLSNTVTATNGSGTIVGSDGKTKFSQFGNATGGAIEVEVGNASIGNNSFKGNSARLGGGIFVSGNALISSNTLQNNFAIQGAVGIFAGDTNLIGSGIYLNNPVNSTVLNAIVNHNTFSGTNSPHDIIMTGYNLNSAFQVTQPGADIIIFQNK